MMIVSVKLIYFINYEDLKQKDTESNIEEWSIWLAKSCALETVKSVVARILIAYTSTNGTTNEREVFTLKTIKVIHT
jgi:hypothetical protein